MKAIDLTNQRFGLLTVIEFYGSISKGQSKPARYWVCKCDCGNIVTVLANSLRQGRTFSCGCLRSERLKERNEKHNMSHSTLYHAWSNMKERCFNKNNPRYKDYGYRGITVCEEWLDFDTFRKWSLENGFIERKQNNRSLLSIDRIDNNGNYEPSNCRWVDNCIQANNKRNVKQYTYKGRTQSLSQWAREMGINLSTLHSRINRLGWSLEEALTTAASYSNCIERGTAFWLKEADD